MTSLYSFFFFFFFFNDTATTEIYTLLYTLSLHDALPILRRGGGRAGGHGAVRRAQSPGADGVRDGADRRSLVDSPRDQSRRGPGRRLRDSRHAARAVPRLLLDVARRPARALGR